MKKNTTHFVRKGLTCLLAAAFAAAVPASAEEPKPVTVGFELDVLPYATGGYYGSAWVGRDRIRLRPVVASTTLPGFLVEDGFREAKVDAYALIVDYFFREGFRGFWVGAGAEYWKSRVENETDGGTAEWNNTVATIGGGYVWKIGGTFYVNPWVAGHLVVGGPTSVTAGGATYTPKRFSPEASVKLGWHF